MSKATQHPTVIGCLDQAIARLALEEARVLVLISLGYTVAEAAELGHNVADKMSATFASDTARLKHGQHPAATSIDVATQAEVANDNGEMACCG